MTTLRIGIYQPETQFENPSFDFGLAFWLKRRSL